MSFTTTFFTADQHFSHPNIVRYEAENRPFAEAAEMDEYLVSVWNDRVRANDIVWILGDLFWTVHAARRILPRLSGRLRLVIGDHDNQWMAKDRSLLDRFEILAGSEGWRHGVLLTHVPALVGGKHTRNIHGHTHGGRIADDGGFDRIGERDEDPDRACVSVEQTGLAPISWEELKSRKDW